MIRSLSARLICLSLAGLSLSLPAYAQGQDAEPAAMRGNARPVQASRDVADHVRNLKSSFKDSYAFAGRPRIALFWNRKLDDQLSQWYTASRSVDTREGAWSSSGFTADQTRQDVEGRFGYRDSPSELAGFEFGAGLTRTLINSGVQIIDRDAIMRLKHGAEPELTPGVVMTDYQEVEMDALLDYADLFAEILYAAHSQSASDFTVMISVKEVRTGRTIAIFRSRESILPEASRRTTWVAGERGYERVEVVTEDVSALAAGEGIEPDSPEYLGWMVALQTMEALSDYWKAGAD